MRAGPERYADWLEKQQKGIAVMHADPERYADWLENVKKGQAEASPNMSRYFIGPNGGIYPISSWAEAADSELVLGGLLDDKSAPHSENYGMQCSTRITVITQQSAGGFFALKRHFTVPDGVWTKNQVASYDYVPDITEENGVEMAGKVVTLPLSEAKAFREVQCSSGYFLSWRGSSQLQPPMGTKVLHGEMVNRPVTVAVYSNSSNKLYEAGRMKTEFEISDWATYCKHVTLQKALDALWHCREAENDRLNNGMPDKALLEKYHCMTCLRFVSAVSPVTLRAMKKHVDLEIVAHDSDEAFYADLDSRLKPVIDYMMQCRGKPSLESVGVEKLTAIRELLIPARVTADKYKQTIEHITGKPLDELSAEWDKEGIYFKTCYFPLPKSGASSDEIGSDSEATDPGLSAIAAGNAEMEPPRKSKAPLSAAAGSKKRKLA